MILIVWSGVDADPKSAFLLTNFPNINDPLPASFPSSRMLRDAEGGTNGKYLRIK